MLTTYTKGDWIQWRNSKGTVYRGVMFVMDHATDKSMVYVDIKHSPEIIRDHNWVKDTVTTVSRESVAPDKKFKLPVSMDSNTSHEQKLRDDNLHWWLSGAGLCTKPWEAPKAALVKTKKQFCRARDILHPSTMTRARGSARIYARFDSDPIGDLFHREGEYPEYEILETLELESSDSHVPWWNTIHRQGLEKTWYLIQYRSNQRAYIHNSRVDVFEKDV